MIDPPPTWSGRGWYRPVGRVESRHSTRHARLPAIEMAERVIFPGDSATVYLSERPGGRRKAVSAAVGWPGGTEVVLLYRGKGGPADVGTLAEIHTSGCDRVSLAARARFDIERISRSGPLVVSGRRLFDPPSRPDTGMLVLQCAPLVNALFGSESMEMTDDRLWGGLPGVFGPDPGLVADRIAAHAPWLDHRQRLVLLSTRDPHERLEHLLAMSRAALGLTTAQDEEPAEGWSAARRYRQQVTDRTDLPDEVRRAARREVNRLHHTPVWEADTVIRWLDLVLEMPWQQQSPDQADLAAARAVLDAEHRGMDPVKDRIVEFLAVTARNRLASHNAILLVGPPGVGKTSVARAIARAMERQFAQVALGGVAVEAAVRGFDRTWRDSAPGLLVKALRTAGTRNPVILLDEIDRMGTGNQNGDPAAALLEALDPVQRADFRDHYLDLGIDLSAVLFVATANSVDAMTPSLLDRMDVIEIDGYSDVEKEAIVRTHLLPARLADHALTPSEVSIDDGLVAALVAADAGEPGLRRLDQRLTRLLGRVALRLAHSTESAPIELTAADVVSGQLALRSLYTDPARRDVIDRVEEERGDRYPSDTR